VLNYLGQSYPSHVAGVFAGNAFFRSAFGGALPMAARRMLQSLGIGWASSVLGFISLAMIPPLFVLYRVRFPSSPLLLYSKPLDFLIFFLLGLTF
jgi:DHA1 family multidrug resistance protein-like MFS transporter